MRIVITRDDSTFGRKFLESLSEPPDLLLVERSNFKQRFKKAWKLGTRIGIVDAVRYNIRFFSRAFGSKFKAKYRYDNLAKRVEYVDSVNDQRAAGLLQAEPQSFVYLAQSGIISKKILQVGPRRFFNAHPGRIPLLRGVDVVRWALLESLPLEVTLHEVDAGIDTGQTILRRPVPVLPTDSIQDVEARSTALCIELLARAYSHPTLANENPKEDFPKGPLRFLMNYSTVARLEQSWPTIRSKYVANEVV